jgi:hypothetical protein
MYDNPAGGRATMATSKFWGTLSKRFGALLKDIDRMCAEWDYTVDSSEWTLSGAAGIAPIKFLFHARRGGEVLNPGSSDFLVAWLNALRLWSGHSKFKMERFGHEQNTDGSAVKHHHTGIIHRVCEASANYCSEMEVSTRKAELWNKLQAQHERKKASEIAYSKAEDVTLPVQELAVMTADDGPDRSRLVDDFLQRCNRESPIKLRRKHVWLAAGHGHARQFQYWQERSDKATAGDVRNFRRILRMTTAEFTALLKKKGIPPLSS